LLFRTSNAAVASAYAGTPYPRVSQLGNDFFKSGLIRSETDYIVYEDMNDFTPGLDVAFFKPRSLYHTSLDDIRHASRGSLQHMLSTALTTVRNLANNIAVENFNYGGQPVYFDFLAGNFAQLRMGVMWICNVLLLVLCPWTLSVAFVWRVEKFGKITLHGKGVATSAIFAGLIVVLGTMAIFSIKGAAVHTHLGEYTDNSWYLPILHWFWHLLCFSHLPRIMSLFDFITFFDRRSNSIQMTLSV